MRALGVGVMSRMAPGSILCDIILIYMLIKRLLVVVSGGGPCGGALLGYASRRALSVGRVRGDVDVLLGAGANVEARDVDELPPHADVTLADEDAGVVDALGESLLEDLRLEAALQQLLGGELQDEVELELVLGEEAVAVHATEEGGTLEDALGILGVEGKEGAGSLTELRERVLYAPDLALASEAVLAHELELRVEALLLEGSTGGLVGLPVVPVLGVRWHGLISIDLQSGGMVT
jgi:hypothetical protein